MKKYLLRIQKIGTEKVLKKSCTVKDINPIIRALVAHGYNVIGYCELSAKGIKLLTPHRRASDIQYLTDLRQDFISMKK